MKIVSLSLLAILTSFPAFAASGSLDGRGSDIVFVWKSKDAHNEALSLIEADVHKSNPALVMKLLACAPAHGTKAITTDAGFVTHDIMVTEGENSGCRGNIAAESFDID